MSERNVTTVREALLAQLLEDVDALVLRIENLDNTLGNRIEQATKNASGQAFLAAKLSLQSAGDELVKKLNQAAQESVTTITEKINEKTSKLIESSEIWNKNAWKLRLYFYGCTLFAGLLGGLIGKLFSFFL